MMKQGDRYVQIGTTRINLPGDTNKFLDKVSQYRRLKEQVYA